jgi:hypothetical protein
VATVWKRALAPGFSTLVLLGAAAMGQTPTPTPAPAASATPSPTPSPTKTPLPPPKSYRIPRAAAPIKVDGVLDEEVWKDASLLTLDWETNPGDNVPPPVKTEVLLTEDGRNLYVGIRAYDPKPSQIRAHLSDRDRAFSDDFTGIVVDPFNDERRAFEFFANPLGVQMDLFNDDVARTEDETWDTIWSSAGKITPEGYVLEFAIPYSSLRFPRRPGEQTWGLDLVRIYPRSNRHRIGLSPLSRDRNCYLCQFAKLTGFEGITPGKNLEFDPTVTAQRTDEREDFPDGELVEGEIDVEPGLTARWGFTPNLTLNAAINPDFSQVEADVAQLDANPQFALFFPEKRPFFLEGADFFTTPIQAVYTRTVADPEWGAKITGKEGRHAIGAYVAGDEITNLILPGAQSSDLTTLEQENTAAVLRYRFDLRKGATLGALFTSREGDGYENTVYGVDANVRLGDKDLVYGQALTSRTEYPQQIVEDFGQPNGRFDDEAYRFEYRHNSRDWFWRASYDDIGTGFRADSGFLPQVDYRRPILGIERVWWGDKAKGDWYTQIFTGGDWDRTEEKSSGQRLEEEFEGYVGMQGPLQSFAFVGVGTRDRFFGGMAFDDERFANLEFEIRPVGDFYIFLYANLGDQIDFVNVQPADRVRMGGSVRWNLGRHLKFEIDHTYEHLNVEGGRLFTAHLPELRTIWQFDVRTFVRLILQYEHVDRDLGLYDNPADFQAETRQLFTQFLFAWKANPQTVFFLGYSDNRDNETIQSMKLRNRTIFAKIGYAWVL